MQRLISRIFRAWEKSREESLQERLGFTFFVYKCTPRVPSAKIYAKKTLSSGSLLYAAEGAIDNKIFETDYLV